MLLFEYTQGPRRRAYYYEQRGARGNRRVGEGPKGKESRTGAAVFRIHAGPRGTQNIDGRGQAAHAGPGERTTQKEIAGAVAEKTPD